MRLFTGLDIPDEARAQAAALIDRLRAVSPARWSPPENLHITTKFIGEWPEARLDELRERLSDVAAPGPLTVRLGSVGWFPNPHQPNILWIAVAEPGGLAGLAAATEDRLAAAGIAREERRYTPHLTLARLGRRDGAPPVNVVALRRELALHEPPVFAPFEAREFHLYASAGGRYTRLAAFPLTL
ncbi:MAG: RNA 2',3'-cyclic phosphodiesterase [Bryobacterales bacterium]|nr:RNA 2',3'-cyclic phosphodiesterase [Bryobacterales bacterium]